jgi:hypothetical protein
LGWAHGHLSGLAISPLQDPDGPAQEQSVEKETKSEGSRECNQAWIGPPAQGVHDIALDCCDAEPRFSNPGLIASLDGVQGSGWHCLIKLLYFWKQKGV